MLDDDSFHDLPLYKSVFVTPKRIRGVEQLQGTRVAFNDEASLSGFHAIREWLARDTHSVDRRSTAPADFFSSWLRTGGHAKSLAALRDGRADAAAIDVLVWTRMRTSSPEQCAGLHELPLDDVTLVTSASQPFVAGAHVSEDTRRKLSEGLLALHEGSGSADGTMTLEGRVGLSHVRRFARVTDREYDSTRLVLRASASVEISHKIVGEAPGASGETGNAAAKSAPAAEEAMSVKRSSRFC